MSPRKPKPLKQPAPLKPWDLRPKADRGASSIDDIYRAVGRALSTWESIESQFAFAFTIFVGDPLTFLPSGAATRAFGSVVSFANRMDMLETAAETFFFAAFKVLKADPKSSEDPDWETTIRAYVDRHITDFGGILSDIRQLAGRRNNIAHGVARFSDEDGGRLSPAIYNSKKHPLKEMEGFLSITEAGSYQFTDKDIQHYEKGFRDVGKRLAIFTDSLVILSRSVQMVKKRLS